MSMGDGLDVLTKTTASSHNDHSSNGCSNAVVPHIDRLLEIDPYLKRYSGEIQRR